MSPKTPENAIRPSPRSLTGAFGSLGIVGMSVRPDDVRILTCPGSASSQATKTAAVATAPVPQAWVSPSTPRS